MNRRVALVCAAILICGCGRAVEEPAAIPERGRPVFEVASKVEVSFPESLVWPAKSLSQARDIAVDPPNATGVIRRIPSGTGFERDERVACLAPGGSRYRFELALAGPRRLTTSMLRLADPASTAPLHPRILVHEGGREPKLLYERTLAGTEGFDWIDLDVDLSAFAGKSVTVELEVEEVKSGDEARAWLAWSIPRVAPPQVDSTKLAANPKTPLNILWISVDTLRADRLGAYGHTRPTSPNLDRLASSGIRFQWAISQAPWTRPSHRSMLTGIYPLSRGGLDSPAIGGPLHQAGYRTFALTGGGQMDSSFGFARGFEIFRVFDWIHDPAPTVDWLQAHTDAPFFAFLHTYEAHEPYTQTRFAAALPSGRLSGEYSKKIHGELRERPTDEEKAYVSALYDGDIAYTDEGLGKLFAELERRGLMETTAIVVTSDHGEQFWEHGTWGHGQSLHDHQIRVPLLVHLPKSLGFAASRVIEDQMELVDLYPTLLDLAGVPLASEVQGRSLRPLLEGGTLPPRMAFSEGTNIKSFEKRSLRTPRYKFVLWERRKLVEGEPDVYELFDLRADPGEQKDLFGRFPERAAELKAEILRRVEGADTNRDEEVPAGIDAELRKQLEALGYIGN